MITNSIDTTFERVVESAKQLEEKDQIRLIKKLLPNLRLNKLQHLSLALEDAISDAIQQQDEIIEKRAKFLYKVVKSNTYVTLRVWGREECNEYLGSLPFLPNNTYKLTNIRTGETKTLIGHGLYREANQLYMKIEQLTPVHQVVDYLYYDRDAEFPRRPQDIVFKKIFSKKDWKIENLKDINRADTQIENKGDKTNNFTLQKGEVEATPQLVLQTHKNRTLGNTVNKLPKKQSVQTIVQVSNNFSSQVKSLIEQWVELTKLLQQEYQWNLVKKEKSIFICNSKEKILVEYNIGTQTIAIKSPHILLNLLKQNMQVISKLTLATEEQKSLASRYLVRLNDAPQHDANKLLAYLFAL